mgnify:CR=1 FL=1
MVIRGGGSGSGDGAADNNPVGLGAVVEAELKRLGEGWTVADLGVPKLKVEAVVVPAGEPEHAPKGLPATGAVE